jgi:hypothetical protein
MVYTDFFEIFDFFLKNAMEIFYRILRKNTMMDTLKITETLRGRGKALYKVACNI